MKNLIAISIIALCTALTAKAQNINQQVNKIDNEIAKTRNTINSTGNTIQNTRNTINETSETVGSLWALIPKGKRNKSADNSTQNTNSKQSGTVNSNEDKTNLNKPQNSTAQLTQSTIIISNVDYMKMKSISQSLKEIAGVVSVEPSLTANTATFKVKHSETTDSLLDNLMSKNGDKINVQSLNNGLIELASK